MNRKQRHLGRELALLWLFQIDIGHHPSATVMTDIPDELEGVEEEGAGFARQLTEGVLAHRDELDEYLTRYSKGWPVMRMAGVERNVLRMAVYEILHLPEIPASVSIDEAVEVAKRYGAAESGKFVNGILGAFFRAERGPAEPA
jgi:N utilization substance protein B